MSKILIDPSLTHDSTRHVGTHAMSILQGSGYELIVNPQDSEPSREWVLHQIADPQVGAACIMHSQPSDKVDQEFIDACNENLKCVSTFSVGYGVLNDAVADITVMLVLMTLRKVGYGINLVKRGEWPQIPWAPFVLCGHSLGHPGLKIGFLGFGRIPQAAVDRLLAFTNKTEPPTIIYTSSRERENQATIDANFTKRWGVDIKRVEKDILASQADVLIVLCDLNPSTKDIVNKDFLAKMKPTSILVNVARGPVVNSDDLHAALKSGQIFGAGLDVLTGEPNIKPDHPLLHLDNCIVLPHLGSGDFDTRNKMAELCVRNAIQSMKGEPLLAEVKG
ncbi:glyoxylate reductase [Kwoniella mangroviensis CBS 10435]|uniref:Glyoxylate reductase n=1 Tax=Kwoniella mangroviensis CBS 10435 TaxID=1331196 RepID=A0A1B9IES9_9TREE|nr:glyoxylate reductase [Kwoniella mangroviensis CBS 10435]